MQLIHNFKQQTRMLSTLPAPSQLGTRLTEVPFSGGKKSWTLQSGVETAGSPWGRCTMDFGRGDCGRNLISWPHLTSKQQACCNKARNKVLQVIKCPLPTASRRHSFFSSSKRWRSVSSKASCLDFSAASMSFLADWELSDSWEPVNKQWFH